MPPGPADFALWLQTDAVTLPRGGQAKLKVLADRIGNLKEPIALTVTGLPAGVSVSGNMLAAGQTAVDLTFKAEGVAAIDVARLKIEGTATLAGKALTRVAKLRTADVDSVLLAVALPTPFVIKGEYDMGFAARGGHVGEQECSARVCGLKPLHQRCRRARLADRHGVDPIHRARLAAVVASKALADLPAVTRLLAPAPPQAQRQQRQRG